MIKSLNIITQKNDFKRICQDGCIVCRNNNFKYISNRDVYVCTNCNSNYTFSANGIINYLLSDNNACRIYIGNSGLIDEFKLDLEVQTKILKNNNSKIKRKVSSR